MKSKEIIKQLNLENGVNSKNQRKFFDAMVEELKDAYKGFGQKDSERHFEAAVKQVKTKWDSISIQVKNGISDGTWRFFFATEIVKLKETLCPSWKERKDIEHAKYEERKRKREEREQRRREREQYTDNL